MSKHTNLPFLKHILDAVEDIESSIKSITKGKLKKNKDIKDATIRRIEVIGEAVKNISKELKIKYPEVEWKKIAGSRDVMIHAYFNVDLDVVWNIAKIDLPVLKKQIQQILEAETKKEQ